MDDDVVAPLPVDTLRDEAQAKRRRADQRDLPHLSTDQVGRQLSRVDQQVARHEILLIASDALGRVTADGIAHTGRQRAYRGMGEIDGILRNGKLGKAPGFVGLNFLEGHRTVAGRLSDHQRAVFTGILLETGPQVGNDLAVHPAAAVAPAFRAHDALDTFARAVELD